MERKFFSFNNFRDGFDIELIGRVIKKIGYKGLRKGNFKNLGGVVLNIYGEIVVVDYFNNRVEVFNEVGKFLFKFGKKGSGDG